ncbi:MAG: glycosyltransferase family 2 protein [Stellaceae bacterium]|jgi:undecaprenyl-phosphate 4-deoxy-4-formamido-L-arabinose transferase
MTSFALSIVIPVYNGARSIGPLVAALAGLEIPGGHEIVLVNDNSPDDSLDVCRELIRKTRVPVTLVDLARNYGEHNAVMAGLRQARGSHVITMDDDLQNPPDEVLRLLRHAQQTGADLVYAKPIEKQHAGWRNLGSRFTNRVADFVLDKPKGLYLSSFRCISAFAASQATSYDGPFPYIDGLLLQVTQRIESLEVEHLAREHGSSNYNLRRLVRLWLSMFVNFSIMPLRLATFAGFTLSFLGVIGAAWAAVDAIFLEQTPPGWASLTVAVMLLSGVQLLILGLIGEYLGRIYLTVNRKPQAVVREVSRNEAAERAARPGIVRSV